MDTTATTIFSRLNASNMNTALILTDTFKQNIAYIQKSLPEVNVLFAPMSLYHPQFLCVLQTTGVGITCSNQELLDYVQESNWGEGTIIGNDFISRSFIRSAYGAGCTKFTVSSIAEIRRIEACVGAGNAEFIVKVEMEDTAEIWKCTSSAITGIVIQGALDTVERVAEKGALLHSVLQKARAGGHVLRHVILGSLTCAAKDLVESISSLKSSLPLPEGAKMQLLLDQEFLDNSLFVATKIIGKETQDSCVKYVVDMSLYDELMCYMGATNHITAIPHTPQLLFGAIHGNSGEDDDVLCSGVVGSHEVGDWILLTNIALVQGSDWELLLMDNMHSSESVEQFPLCEHVTITTHDITMTTRDITMTTRDVTMATRDITMATRDLLMEKPRLSAMFTAAIQVSV